MTTAARLQTAERSINTMARKVLEAVPFNEAWTQQSVAQEMRRARGTAPGLDVVRGCLEQLRSVGLVKLTGAGLFQRVQARAALTLATSAPKEQMMTNTATQPAPPKASPTDTLAALAQSARRMAAALQDMADEIEGVALDYEERIQAVSGDVDKLRQLQALLSSLGQPTRAA